MRVKLVDNLVVGLKALLYGRRGEPYQFGEKKLRFLLGTRPVRTKYRTSKNTNNRNDALQVELILKGLTVGDTAIDIGSHAGQYAILMSARCGPAGDVVCFEPDPDAGNLLRANFALNDNLKMPTIVRAACSDINGSARFFTQGGNSQSSLARSALPGNRITNSIQVETLRLDDWWSNHRKSLPRLIKIDTEGAEIHVLRGMPELLASNAKIVCELHPFAWTEFGVSLSELETIVGRSGRVMKWLDGGDIVKNRVEYGTVLIDRP